MSRLANLPTLPAVLVCLLSVSVEAADIDDDTNERPDAVSVVVAPSMLPWPTQISARDSRFVVYQPQFDKWESDRLDGRAAVAVYAQADEQPSSFGMVWISARAETNRADGIVTIRDLVITKADFPTATDRSGEYLEFLRQQLAAKSWQVPVERLQTDMAIDRAAQQAGNQPLRNDPPKIIFSERAAILVPIDGEPVLREVPGTRLQRIVNTRALILYDPALNNPAAARYYLYVIDHWRQAQHLAGPWSASTNPAADLEKARQLAVKDDQVDLLDDDVEDGEPIDASAVVYVSTEPAELLQIEGPAQYAPIQDTQLLYVTNSPNRIFLDLRTASHYVLLSGRWYRARTLQRGPWEYVAAGKLPGDFALIPPDHPSAAVRAAVAGTPQAREAVIANSVPQVATVTRSAASLEITYDGEPVFQPIEGTPLQSAANAPVPVIRVSEGSFYALDNGVWFTAGSPLGAWSVASSVPAVIYSIPRGSPLHYVTYVRIYDSTPEVVYVGYTPGYVGSYVSSDFVVVYGSGWHYRPWIGTVWYSPPVTWGFGFGIVYNWWNPWWPCCFATWAPHPHFRPHWGPWHQHVRHHRHAQGGAISNMFRKSLTPQGVNNIYGRWDRRAVHSFAQSSSGPDRRARHNPQFRPDDGRRQMSDRDGRRDWNVAGGGARHRADQSPNQRRDLMDREHRAPQRARDGRGSGFVVGPDGRRQDVGDRSGRRDWKDAGADAHNRATLPPIQWRDSVDRNPGARRQPQVRPGNDSVAGTNGHRQDFGNRNGQRDWKDAGADARNRADLPPVQRRDLSRPESGERRDFSVDQRRIPAPRDDNIRNFADLPRVQTPTRRSDASIAPINPRRESSPAIRPQSQAPFTGQTPRLPQNIQERQRPEPAMTRRTEPGRGQPQFRVQPRQFAEPSRVPDQAQAGARSPREWRQDRAAPSFPSGGTAPARPQVLREQGAQMPRVIPDARASGGAQRELFQGGERRGQGRSAGSSGPRFGERQR
ncbi:MAG TPA: hypothetical protein VJT81_04435 [Burkholderiales bacterium]|nr:hypothetical protein [Burkholderiales bacterium]